MTSCLACGRGVENATTPADPAVPVLCDSCDESAPTVATDGGVNRPLFGRVVEVDPEDHPDYSECSLETCENHARSLPFSYAGEGYCSRRCCAEAMDLDGDSEGVRTLYEDGGQS